MIETPITKLRMTDLDNEFYMKRDDLFPYSFGGNKYRKALHYFKHIKTHHHRAVITTGSASSNHCRIIANMALNEGIVCHIVSPEDTEKLVFNRVMTKMFEAHIHVVAREDVQTTIDTLMDTLHQQELNPYYIKNGGHGFYGTKAYAEAYAEINAYEHVHQRFFDYIFFADGTGTTHAGLISGLKCNVQQPKTKIVGISVFHAYKKGAPIVVASANEYLENANRPSITQSDIHYEDDYLTGGYGQYNEAIIETITRLMKEEGIPLDPVYTGKAIYGMLGYLKKHNIQQKRVLFIHTGGTPIYFDLLNNMRR